MKPRPRRKPCPQAGLTLIELLVALAIFALIGVLSWRASSQLIVSQTHLEHQLERWRSLDRGLQIIENALLQSAAPAIPQGGERRPPMRWLHKGGDNALELLTLNVDAAPGRTVFRLRDQVLYWERHAENEAVPVAPESDPLFDHVKDVRWRFWSHQLGWIDYWPPGEEVLTGRDLARAVILELDLLDQGTVSRVYALR